jgi:hypothetical protein
VKESVDTSQPNDASSERIQARCFVLAALPEGRMPNATAFAVKFSAEAPLKFLAVAVCADADPHKKETAARAVRVHLKFMLPSRLQPPLDGGDSQPKSDAYWGRQQGNVLARTNW